MVSASKRLPERDGEHGPGSLAFEVTKPVLLNILDGEITEAMGWRKQAGLVAEGDTTTASAEHPAVVWVLRGEVDSRTVKQAVTAHQGVEAPASDDEEFDRLSAKARAVLDLTAAEVQTALRLLLTRGT